MKDNNKMRYIRHLTPDDIAKEALRFATSYEPFTWVLCLEKNCWKSITELFSKDDRFEQTYKYTFKKQNRGGMVRFCDFEREGVSSYGGTMGECIMVICEPNKEYPGLHYTEGGASVFTQIFYQDEL